MSLISVKETQVGVKKEAAFGTAATLGATDVFEVTGVSMAGKVENIDRTVLRAVLDDFSPMAGRKSTSGNLMVEPVGGGTVNPIPQYAQCMEAAFGGRPIQVIAAVGQAWADDGGVFTDETVDINDVGTADVDLLPAVESIGDAFYFGLVSGPFYGVRILFSTPGVGTAIAWEYYNGAWVALSTAKDYVDGTLGFTATGTANLIFEAPKDWVSTTVNAVAAYYVRARVTAASFTTVPVASQGWLMTRGVVTTVQAASTTTVLNIAAGLGALFAVGMGVTVEIGADDHLETRFITGISTDALTISPAFTVTPTTGRDVFPTATWRPGAGLNAYADSWTVQEWFASIFFQHIGCKSTGLDINVPNVGAIGSLQFNWQGKEGESGNGSPPTATETPGNPIIAMSCQLFKAGVAIDLTSLAVNLRNTATPRPSLRSTGMNDLAITRRRVEGSFNLFTETKAFYDDYLALTSFELYAQIGLLRGNIMAIRCPTIVYTDLSIGDETEAKRYSINFRANPILGNDSLYIAYG